MGYTVEDHENYRRKKGRGRGAPSQTGAPRAGRQEPVATHGVETSTQESAE
jgi:hypothetical protein